MQYFYIPDFEINSNCLTEEDSRHCIKVLRLKKGDVIGILDGNGLTATAHLVNQDYKNTQFQIAEKTFFKSPACSIHIAIAPPKNIDRFEWFLEKATEIGITNVTPVICSRSERKKLNNERLDKVIISALKQSQNPYKPILNAMIDFSEFINISDPNSQKFIAHYEKNNLHFKEMYLKEKNALILIGPEGDFDEKEISLAKLNGFEMINLSTNRLRTETAGLTACMFFNLLNG